MRAGLRSTLVVLIAFLALFVPAAAASAGPAWWWPAPKPAAPDCGSTVYKASGAKWVCTFADEFNSTKLDTSKWVAVTTASNGHTAGGACFVNSPNNISESAGHLNLTVRQEAGPITCKTPKSSFTTQYTSGQVATYTKFSQMYGRYSVRAKFPAATVAGLQSSLWLWPANNLLTGLTGEIDIAEEYSLVPDRAIPYLHYLFDSTTTDVATNTNVVSNNNCMISDVSAFHEYTVEWTPTSFTILYDGQTCLVDNLAILTSPFAQPFFLALTQSLGTGVNAFNPATTPLPATTSVDWVHIWK